MDTAPVQVFIRNEKGQVWGPLALSTIELLFDSGVVKGKVMVSKDGVNYALPGRFPDLRDAFPHEVWGVDAPRPASQQPAPEVPAEVSGAGSEPETSPSHPAAGAVPRAGPGATGGFTAGPGATASASGRASPGGFTAGPGARAAAVAQPRPPPPPRPPPGATPSQTHAQVRPPVMTPSPQAPPPAPPPPAPSMSPPPAPAPAPAPAARKTAPPPPAEGVPLPPPSGNLAEMSAVKLYSLAAGAEMTALITFTLPDRQIHLHLRKGNPEYVNSTHQDDALATFLLKTDLAKPEQIVQAEAQKERFGGELLSALFGSGALNPGAVFGQLIDRAKGLLSRAFLAPSGTFTVEQKELPPQRSMPLGHRWAVLSELSRKMPPPEMKRRLQEAWELPAMKSGGRIPASDLRLTPQELRALSHVDGVRSLAQFQRDMPQEMDAILRVVFLFHELDGISFAAVPSRPAPEAPPPPPPPAPSPPPPSAAPPPAAARPSPATGSKPAAPRLTPVRSPAATKPTPAAGAAAAQPPLPAMDKVEDLRAMAAKIKGQNLFEALSLTDKADASQVKVAYFRLAKVFHPDTVMAGSDPEVAKLKAEIFGRIGDAYRTLSDDKLRADYMEELKHGGKGEQLDVALILQAEELFQKGCILVKARKWPEAVKMLDDAIKANPEEPEFFAWRGYAKFFANPDKKAGQAEALKDINVTVKKNDRIAAAHYFIGHIAKLTGDEKLALKEFKKTVELQPDHIDAAREIRMMSGKK